MSKPYNNVTYVTLNHITILYHVEIKLIQNCFESTHQCFNRK